MDSSKRAWIARSVACLIAIGLTCGPGAVSAQEPLKIGMAIAQTGGLSAGGKGALVAYNLWVEDVNAKGGLLGRKVQLIAYDDQSNPATTPGLYTKLLDVDKVDFLIGPYGTNPTAPIMPLVKQRDILLIGNFCFDVNAKIKHDKWFNNSPWGSGAAAWGSNFLELGRSMGAKTVAFMAADAEFSQNLATGARVIAKAIGLQTVYDQNYPPNTVDFSSMIRAVRNAKPDVVFVASYPSESTAIVRAVNEIGLGNSVKLFGGGMVGLQFTNIMESFGSSLNGIVNYNTFVPEKSMINPGMSDFLKRYAERAKAEKVDPLGFYLPPYAYAAGQILEQAIKATNSFDHKKIAAYLRTAEVKSIVGNFKYDAVGEWDKPGMVMTQFRGIADKNLDQFRQSGKQVIVAPPALKTGDVLDYQKARKR